MKKFLILIAIVCISSSVWSQIQTQTLKMGTVAKTDNSKRTTRTNNREGWTEYEKLFCDLRLTITFDYKLYEGRRGYWRYYDKFVILDIIDRDKKDKYGDRIVSGTFEETHTRGKFNNKKVEYQASLKKVLDDNVITRIEVKHDGKWYYLFDAYVED